VLHVPPTRCRVALAVLAAGLLLAGCGDLDEAAAAQGLTRNDLVSEVAAQLGESAGLTYAATYQLAGGATATLAQAQNPARTAYRYPGGEVLVTTAATTRCAGRSCELTAPPTATSPPPESLFADARKAGLITPAAVLDLLNAAALDTDITVDQHDTTIAGRHATCLRLARVDGAAAAGFSTCVTNDGALGSFTGTVHGSPVDVAMIHYANRVGPAAFDPPRDATTVDHRTG
jgi:hypothetical protein